MLILSVLACATTAAATAAIRWQVWTPPTACLMCEAPTSDAAASLGNGLNGGGIGNGAGSYARSSAGTFVPGPLTAAASGADAMAGSSARAGAAPKGWQPWGTRSGSFRVSSSSGGGPSASLGGLWKLMSLSRPGHGGGAGAPGASSTVAHNTSKPPAASRPSPKPGTPRSSPSAPPASAPFTAGSPTLAGPAPSSGSAVTDPFHEHEAPTPDPFVPPTGAGGFDPGRPGGSGPSAGGGGRVAATPEPGSILLVGTGLLGILGVIRKRRLI